MRRGGGPISYLCMKAQSKVRMRPYLPGVPHDGYRVGTGNTSRTASRLYFFLFSIACIITMAADLKFTSTTTLDRLLAPMQSFLHRNGWQVAALLVMIHYLKKILLPHWYAYLQRKTLQECKDPARVSVLNRNLKGIREVQQRDVMTRAKEAERLAKAKRAEELRRKQVVREEGYMKKHCVGQRLGGSQRTATTDGVDVGIDIDIDEARDRQQCEQLKLSTEEAEKQKKVKKRRINKNTCSMSSTSTSTNRARPHAQVGDDWDELRNEQDEEFRESLAADQAKEDVKTLRLQRRQDALAKLNPEPASDLDDTVLIAFKLPRKCKKGRILRRFSKHSKVDQLAYFLTTTGHLDKVREWRLMSAVGAQQFPSDGHATLEELGLSPRGLVMVVDVDC